MDEEYAWELSKENVAPVARGRNVHKLNDVLVKKHSVEQKMHWSEKEKYVKYVIE